jgi:glycosyltransferase involved in cell wall biosynthesis
VDASLRFVKVLSIAHNAVADSNRRRIQALRAVPEVDVELLTPPWWDEEGQRLHVHIKAPWRVGRTLMTGNGTRHVYLTGLFEAVREYQPDVIDLFEEPFSLVALQTLLARNLFAPRAALVLYSAVNVERIWRLPYRLIERVVLRGADGAHGPNSDVPPILRSRGLTGPAEVIPLGVDPARFESAAELPWRWVPPRPRIGFLGRLEPVKGVDVLISAFMQLRTPASLIVSGDGPERDTVEGPGVFWQPPMEYGMVPRFLKTLDVLVLPSVTIPPAHREQFGRVLTEAMAAGIPVIGSNSGAIPEVIGDAGLIVPERNSKALAEAIDSVLIDAELRARLIERGYQRVAERFTWPIVAQRTVGLFRSAMLHRRGAAVQLSQKEVRA